MKTKKRLTGILGILVVLAMLCLNVLCFTASAAEEKGTVTVRIDSIAEGVPMRLYRVGSYVEGSYVLDQPFDTIGADVSDLSDASKAQEAAELLESAALSSDSATVADLVLISDEGTAVFADVPADESLYLICRGDDSEADLQFDGTVMISPMLVVLPYYTAEGDVLSDVEITAKWEYKEPVYPLSSIILNKENEKGERLAGAEFRLTKITYLDGEPSEEPSDEPVDEASEDPVPEESEIFIGENENGRYELEVIAEKLVTDENGQIVIVDLPLGTYHFTETKAPDGYILDDETIEVKLEEEGTVKLEKGFYVADTGSPAVITFVNKQEEQSVPPKPSEPSIPTQSSEPPPQPSNPVITGDHVGLTVAVILVALASLTAVICAAAANKKNKSDK